LTGVNKYQDIRMRVSATALRHATPDNRTSQSRKFVMFKTILVPTDGSARSDKAINAAIEFAKKVNGKIVGISVVEPYPFPPISESPYTGGSAAYEQRALQLANDYVAVIAAAAAAAGVPCETVVIPSLNPHEEIVKAAERFGCDAIFMATHGRKGLNKLFAGSETQKVIANSSVPVTVFR
jgi:nucleotide-binding universal stress UspA family protein